ncbi:MAG: hypothetical protein COT17_00905 [Elusimicrobia bacterium CG08_land_8_20_14_0_20_51_18]|nr:MAG: hypothetical protein COT17_00905 [Elusimicrobia bacterium CG08_land_8_20_14_0_20_51_18]
MLKGVVLAAGNSSRMGRPKALLEHEGVSFIEIVCGKLRGLGLEGITAVLGRDHEMVLKKWRPQKEEIVLNDRPELGQIHSLRLALKEISSEASFLICLVDQPLIKQETYEAVKDFWLKNPDCIVIPRCRRAGEPQVSGLKSQVCPPDPLRVTHDASRFKRGHPIIIPAVYRDLCFSGPVDKGLHWVTHHEKVRVKDLETEDSGILRDFDTPEDYEKLETGG